MPGGRVEMEDVTVLDPGESGMTVCAPNLRVHLLAFHTHETASRKGATADNRDTALTSSDSENEFRKINLGKADSATGRFRAGARPVRTARFSTR